MNQDKEPRQGTKTGNEDMKQRIRTKTKNGEQRKREDKDKEKEREKSLTCFRKKIEFPPFEKEKKCENVKPVYPTFETVNPVSETVNPTFEHCLPGFRNGCLKNGFAIFHGQSR